MSTIYMTNSEFKRLQQANLNKDVPNTEGTIYVAIEKENWCNNKKVIKYFEEEDKDKISTLNLLMQNKAKINIEELVFPEDLVMSNGQIVGYTMPYIEGANLQELYYLYEDDPKTIIKYLKQIGEILEKFKN